MKFNRQSIRLINFDYGVGIYFVTIDSWKKNKYFGEIVDRNMVLNSNGIILDDEIKRTSEIRKEVSIDIYQIMPDHLHMILVINKENKGQIKSEYGCGSMQSTRTGKQNLGNIVGGIKRAVSKKLKLENKIYSPIWHRNYYERVIRNHGELLRIRNYIRQNPKKY